MPSELHFFFKGKVLWSHPVCVPLYHNSSKELLTVSYVILSLTQSILAFIPISPLKLLFSGSPVLSILPIPIVSSLTSSPSIYEVLSAYHPESLYGHCLAFPPPIDPASVCFLVHPLPDL